MSVGAINGFGGIWLQSRGLSVEDIGLIFALPIVGVLLASIPVGRLADRAEDWRNVIVSGALLSAILPLGLLIAESFLTILIFWTLTVVTRTVIGPVSDAAALRRSRREDGDFARLYAWKTAGYLAIIFGTGLAVEAFGIGAFLTVFLSSAALYGVLSLTLPRFRATKPSSRPKRELWIRSADRALLLPLLGWTFVHCTHSILNAFLGVLWVDQGVTAFMVGVLIAFSGIIETGVFASFNALLRQFQPVTLILISCTVGVVRWAGFALSPPIEVLFFLQALHGVTYAVGFIACTNLIADLAEEDVAAEAQSAFHTMQFATAFIALIAFGWLADSFGARAFFGSSLLAAIGAILVGMVIKQVRLRTQEET